MNLVHYNDLLLLYSLNGIAGFTILFIVLVSTFITLGFFAKNFFFTE